MKNRFGALFRGLIQQTVEPPTAVRCEEPVDPEVQHIDVYIDRDEPTEPIEPVDPRLGLLGKITAERALLEGFHEPPSVEDIGDCLMKQRTVHANRRRAERSNAEKTKRAEKKLEVPYLWIVSAGDPVSAKRALGFAPLTSPLWPKGVYAAVSGLRLGLVVISELPVTRATLLMRVLGAGATLSDAISELHDDARDSWEAEVALPLLDKLRIEHVEQKHRKTAPATISFTDTEYEDFMNVVDRAIKAVEERRQANQERERAMSEMQERTQELREQVVQSELVATRKALRLVLATRGISLAESDAARIDSCVDAQVLSEWLTRAVSAGSMSEVFAST